MSDHQKLLRHRGVLVGTALVALAIGSSAIGVWAVYRLPAPEHAEGRNLMRWLVTRDLAEESDDTRRKLVRQLEVYLLDTQDLSSASSEMNDQRRTTLEANVDVLLPVWLTMGAEKYAQLEPRQHPAYLDLQLSLVERIGTLSELWSKMPRHPDEPNPLFALVAEVEHLIAGAPATERPALEAYTRAVKLRWFATTDLSQLSTASLHTLTDRIEHELRDGLVVADESLEFEPAKSRQLWRNVDLLAEVWFHRQVETYWRISPAEQPANMTRRIADVSSWPIVEQQLTAPRAAPSFTNPLSLLTNNPLSHAMKQMAAAQRRIDNWIRRAPPEMQTPMRKFTADARTALHKQYLKQLLP